MAVLKPARTNVSEEVTALIKTVNKLSVAVNALLAKLDTDATIAATDFASTVGTQDTISTITTIR